MISTSKSSTLGLGKLEETSYVVVVPSRELNHCTKVYRCILLLKILMVVFLTDDHVMNIGDLDIILCMVWLRLFKVMIEFENQNVRLKQPMGDKMAYKGFVLRPRRSLC